VGVEIRRDVSPSFVEDLFHGEQKVVDGKVSDTRKKVSRNIKECLAE
jgi:hypothetical protein